MLQAKFRRVDVGNRDAEWLRQQITKELDAWLNPQLRRVIHGRMPDHLVVATNLRLTSVPQSGGIDRARTLLDDFAERLGLKGWALWDANQLSMLLDAHSSIVDRFAEFLTPGDVLAKTMHTLGSLGQLGGATKIAVGQGDPGLERAFRAAHRAVGGEDVLGHPTSPVHDDGPGWVQHFDTHGTGAVICARGGQPAVVVPADLWDAIRAAGTTGLASVGYPIHAETGPSLIATGISRVPLDGGSWGRGNLVRAANGTWRWEPAIRFSFDTRERTRWSASSDPMELRLRSTAVLPWRAEDIAVDHIGRQRMGAALHNGPLQAVLSEVATHLGLDGSRSTWERTPPTEGYNDRLLSLHVDRPQRTVGRRALGTAPATGRDTVRGHQHGRPSNRLHRDRARGRSRRNPAPARHRHASALLHHGLDNRNAGPAVGCGAGPDEHSACRTEPGRAAPQPGAHPWRRE